MIGNEKKLELIQYRKQTLEDMKMLLWKLGGVPESEVELRRQYLETIKVFGEAARDAKLQIEAMH